MDEMDIIEFENLPSTKTPINAANLNQIQINAKKAIKNKKAALELLTVSIVAPTECKAGDKYYNTIDKKIYTATEDNIWGTDGTEPLQEYLYIDLGNKNLYYYDGTNFNSYGGGSGGGDTLPIGTIVPYGSDVIPDGWLRCDGSIVEQSDYPELFSVIGTTYGYYGRTDFKLPDLQGRVAVGKNTVIDTENPDTDFNELGKYGGKKEHTLTIDEMPSHTHKIQVRSGGIGDYYGDPPFTDANAGNLMDGGDTKSTGGSQPHNNLQPYLVTNYIIKAKMTVSIKGEIIQENGTASMDNVYSAVAVDNKLKTNIVIGEEIATNEYIDGERVYKRIIQENNVTLASNTTHKLTHNILNCKEIVDSKYLLRFKDGDTYYNYSIWQGVKHFRVSNNEIQLFTETADSTFEYIKYTLKYTKN